MAEYIEREATIQYFKKRSKDFIGHEPIPPALVIMGCANEVDAIPAADVRPVVLCADCQYTKSDGCGAIYCEKWDMWEMPPDGFCYKGKRRTHDTQNAD